MMSNSERLLSHKLKMEETHLVNLNLDLHKAMQIASELEQQVEFSKEQIILIQAQLDRCKS